MKILLTITLFSLFISLSAQSYIRVSNNAGAVADYTSLQTAIDNALVGATIFVEPSTTPYGSITINKRIILLGGGYDVSKHDGKTSTIGQVTFNKLAGDPSGTFISGIRFSAGINGYQGVDSIYIQRCYISNTISLSNVSTDSVVGWKIVNCNLHTISSSGAKNIVISNNIIRYQLNGFNNYSIFISNNIFIGSYTIGSCSFASFSNNIFYNNIPSSCSYCTFSNNLSGQNTSTFNYGTNICLNNIEGVNNTEIFINYGTDYHLKPTCPGVNAGADGKDIGIYGGLFPFPNEDYGITGFPEINALIIANPLVEPNGTLKVNIKSTIIH